MTPSDLFTRVGRMLHVIGQGESLETAEAETMRVAFNEMVESWGRNPLLQYLEVVSEHTIDISAATNSGANPFVVGSSQDIDITRPEPADLLGIGYLYNYGETSEVETPVRLFRDVTQWRRIRPKLTTTSQPISAYYRSPITSYNSTTLVGHLYLWPVPDSDLTLRLYTRFRLPQFTAASGTAPDVDDDIGLPDGYLRALRFNLAVEVATEFGVPLDDKRFRSIPVIAAQSLEMIQRPNHRPLISTPDPAAVGLPSGDYDINSDSHISGSGI